MHIPHTDEKIYIHIIHNTNEEIYIHNLHKKLENTIYTPHYSVLTKTEFHTHIDDAIYNLLQHGVLYSIDGKICLSFGKIPLGVVIIDKLKEIPTWWE